MSVTDLVSGTTTSPEFCRSVMRSSFGAAAPVFAATALAMVLAGPAPVFAQTRPVAPPGPYVIDVRGTTLSLPQDTGFYPELPEAALVPARGFGIDVGAHVYVTRFGPGRVGIGASFIQVRGSNGAASLTTRLVAPQVSLNFGTTEGWSYLSAGVGTANVKGQYSSGMLSANTSRVSDTMMAVNFGGGARWFFAAHLAVNFDLRLFRLSGQPAQIGLAGTPSTTLGQASVGLSVR